MTTPAPTLSPTLMQKIFGRNYKFNKKDWIVLLAITLFYIIYTVRSWYGYEILLLPKEDCSSCNYWYWTITKLLWIPFTLAIAYFYFGKAYLHKLGFSKLDKKMFWWLLLSIALLTLWLVQGFWGQFEIFLNFKFPYSNIYGWGSDIIIIAFGEELLFRGFLLAWLEEKFNLGLAILLSSVLFSLVHYCWWVFVGLADFDSGFNVFLFGILLGIIKHYSKNIFNCTFIHFLNNFILRGLGF